MTEDAGDASPDGGDERQRARGAGHQGRKEEVLDRLQIELEDALEKLETSQLRGIEAHRRARNEGRMVRVEDELAEIREIALRALVQLMTPETILRACNIKLTQAEREAVTGEALMDHLRQHMEGWNAVNFRDRVTVLARLKSWLLIHAPGTDINQEISQVTMQRFFTWVHKNAGEQHSLGKRGRDGTRAGQGAWEAISFFERNWGFCFHAQECKDDLPWLHTDTKSIQPKKEARPFSPGIVAALMQYVSRPDVDPVLRHIACVLLIMTFTGLRWKGAQTAVLYGDRTDLMPEVRVVFGHSLAKKPGKNQRCKPEPFWLVLVDLLSTGEPPELWSQWQSSVRDLREIAEKESTPLSFLARSIYREGAKATLENGPMQYSQMRSRMWRVLQEACGFDKTLAKTFTPHSTRHFLTNLFCARGESKQARSLTGEWAGWASKTEMKQCTWAPAEMYKVAKRQMMRMPDEYAKHALATRSIAALHRNLVAVQKYIAACGGPAATLGKETFSPDGLSDILNFDKLEKQARLPGEDYD